MIYLDYQATTPLAPESKAAMLPWLDRFANPHSPNREGRAAAAAIAVARAQVAALLPPGGTVAFTGGATEALNWAIKQTRVPGRDEIVTIATEHAAVLDTVRFGLGGAKTIVLPVRADGRVDQDAARAAIGRYTALVAVMLVNNEIGVIQPIAELAGLTHAAGARFLCDAVQGFGRMPVPDACDLIAVSAHKLHGPKGIGALWARDGMLPLPLLHGGGQEAGVRSGTLSPMLCAGFGAAAALAGERMDADAAHVAMLWERLRYALGPDWRVNGSIDARYRGNLNVRREGLDANRLISEVRDIAFSAGSACASGSGRPSHVLRALGLSDAEARGSIRLGFGRYTTVDEIDTAAGLIAAAAARQEIWA